MTSGNSPSCPVEVVAVAITSESSAGPSTSVPGSAGNLDALGDSQNIPSTSDVPKATSEKALTKKTAKPRTKRITAK